MNTHTHTHKHARTQELTVHTREVIPIGAKTGILWDFAPPPCSIDRQKRKMKRKVKNRDSILLITFTWKSARCFAGILDFIKVVWVCKFVNGESSISKFCVETALFPIFSCFLSFVLRFHLNRDSYQINSSNCCIWKVFILHSFIFFCEGILIFFYSLLFLFFFSSRKSLVGFCSFFTLD